MGGAEASVGEKDIAPQVTGLTKDKEQKDSPGRAFGVPGTLGKNEPHRKVWQVAGKQILERVKKQSYPSRNWEREISQRPLEFADPQRRDSPPQISLLVLS